MLQLLLESNNKYLWIILTEHKNRTVSIYPVSRCTKRTRSVDLLSSTLPSITDVISVTYEYDKHFSDHSENTDQISILVINTCHTSLMVYSFI